VLVNATAAAELFGSGSALGHRLSITHALTETEMATVVGVVGDVRYGALEEPPMPAVYLSERQAAMPYGTLFVRTAGEPAGLLDAIRQEARALAADAPLFDASTLGARRAAATARTRVVLALLAAFALSGLLIGAVGLYGIVSHTVARRTPEVGLRIALGAEPASVLRLVVSRPFGLAVASALLGLAGAAFSTRWLERLLYGASAFEPGVLAASALVLLAAALVAAWLPARRATTVDPVRALRAE
jgi:predicted lysophospholipase L1 biosynthesis ABC-type transport system permease subunit